jgi:3D (Asp-Asp-Asp) domain-containing protein
VVTGLEVEIKHARAITLRLGSSSSVIYTHKQSLREALLDAGLALGADDRVEPSGEAAVTNGMTARLVRVGGRTLTERETVKRKTVLKPDESLVGFGTRSVQGRDGTRVREYKIVIEDGVEREKTLVREYMEPEVQDNVIYYSPAAARATGTSATTMTVVDTERMWATWYNAASSGRPASNPAYGVTATGVQVTRGIVAVDPTVIPLGSRLYVPGYGFAVAADTGGAVKGNIIDLGYADDMHVDWRTGWTDVYFLAP